MERRARAPAAGVQADIFITTWNEPVKILRNTLLAARAVRHVRTVWLLDDGARDEMKQLAEELGVAYLSRIERDHAKAGNLNNALKHCDSEFIAVFDCDHAPSSDFLEKTLGFFSDPRVAFVQTPQDFYNIDSFQHRGNRPRNEVWHEQALFYRVIQPGKDRWNAAFFCGSCAIVRRSALDDIGGFATGTITEDLHTSLKLHKKGWVSVYHAEALAFGLSPAVFDQYQTQRLRWARGAMQVWVQEGFLFSKGLSIAQKLSYLASTSTYFEGWQKGIVYFLPIVVILTGWMPLDVVGFGFLALFTAWLLSGMLVNEIVSRGYAKTIWMEEYNFFRYFTFIRSTLALFVPINWRFVVTPKGRIVGQRGWIKLFPQFTLAVGAVAALVVGGYLYVTKGHLSPAAFALTLVFLGFDMFLGWSSLKFAGRHLIQRRASHRFPIPFPVTVNRPGWPSPIVAEDVSSDGMLLTAYGAGVVKNLKGVLHLPNGDLPFRGTVVRRFGAGKMGILFNWSSPSEADPLNSCLYGNSLQWDINNWSETAQTIFSLARRSKGVDSGGSWQIATICSDDDKPVQCIARTEARDGLMWRLVSYQPPKAGSNIDIETQATTMSNLQVAVCHAFDVGGGKVYVSTLTKDIKSVYFRSHLQPHWAHRLSCDAATALPAM